MPKFKPRVTDIFSAAAIGGLLFTGMWAELDAIPGGAIFFSVLVFAGALAAVQGTLGFAKAEPPKLIQDVVLPNYWILVALLLAPTLVLWGFTWTWEFPMSGDHDHHLAAVYQARKFWSEQVLWFFAFIGIMGFGLVKVKSPWWILAAFAIMFGVSHVAQVPEHYFVRYPASVYLIASPFFALGEALNWADLFNAARIPSTLALVFWLGVRPFLFSRPNHWGFLVAAILMVWQKYHVYYFTSAYLEMWSVVLLLLAVESLVSEDRPTWWALLFAGAATFFKDTAILIWPFFILAVLLIDKKPKAKLWHLSLSGIISVPFFVYFVARKESQVFRTFELVSFGEAFTSHRLNHALFRLVEQFHWTGLLAFVILLGWGFANVFKSKIRSSTVLLLFGAGLLQILILFMDRISQDATAYPRFHVMPLALILAPVFAGLKNLRGKQAWLAVAIAVSGQVASLAQFFAMHSRPAYARNFSEGYSVPLHLPIRYLVRKAEEEGVLKKGQSVWLTPASDKTRLNIFPLVYRDLMNYTWKVTPLAGAGAKCRCDSGEAYMLLTPRPMNLNVQFPSVPYEDKISLVTEECERSVLASCGRCVTADWPGQKPLGWLCSN